MTAYLDSSVVLRHILRGDASITHALEFPRIVSSELLEIECRRVIHRLRMTGGLDDETVVAATRRLEEVLGGIDLAILTASIKRRAMESFPVVVRTLDALHLSTALAFNEADQEGVTLFSHDRSMNLCALSLGVRAPFLEG